MTFLLFALVFNTIALQSACKQIEDDPTPIPAADRTELYLDHIKGKRVALVANQTSVIGTGKEYRHLVDSLLTLGIDIKKVFAPEHGFRGKQDDGEKVEDQIDPRTKLPLVSLYGKSKKPGKEHLADVDLVIFDIQDVGARFYTFISTLHYIMESCAENDIPLLLLDRPNPNGHYLDGPVLEEKHKSFVGMHPVPVVYGMTIGEYGKMINGEGWLNQGLVCDLQVIPLKNYSHQSVYELPVLPSPNLPNTRSVNLYPSLCFFEGTVVSCGRGTGMQFQVFGAPELPKDQFAFEFTPRPNFGSKYPKHDGKTCHGLDLRTGERIGQINLEWLISAYRSYPDQENFFKEYFLKLAGTKTLRQQVESGMSAEDIRAGWKTDLDAFKKVRSKYLLYD